MTVYRCSGCSGPISHSVIPGGNPVALENGWATSWKMCSGCERMFCDKCAEEFDPVCSECPGTPPPPTKEQKLGWIRNACQNQAEYREPISWAWIYTWGSSSMAERIALLTRDVPREDLEVLIKVAKRESARMKDAIAYYLGGMDPDFDDDSERSLVPKEFIVALSNLSLD